MSYASEYHARRMATDPEYREKRRQYAAAQNRKRTERLATDEAFAESVRVADRHRYAVKSDADPAWVASERERKRILSAERLKRCPDIVRRQKRVAQATRRARKLDQFLEAVDPTVVYQMYGGMCGICKEFIEGDFHVDHIKPLSKGGLHGYFNCQPAHPKCNQIKSNKYDG